MGRTERSGLIGSNMTVITVPGCNSRVIRVIRYYASTRMIRGDYFKKPNSYTIGLILSANFL